MRIVAVFSLAALITLAFLYIATGDTRKPSYGEAKIGGRFALTDTEGRKVSDKDFHGKMMLVYMGYSRCPDICPMTLGVISETIKALGGDAEKIAFLFISLDPDYDTPATLKLYLTAFDPHIVGLTGSKEEIAAAAAAYRVFYKQESAASGPYHIDHSGLLYLMGVDGKYLMHFSSEVKAPELAAAIRTHL